MTSRRVLIVNYEFPPLGGGGGHASAHIAARLASWGYDVTVLTSRFKGLPAEEARDGVRVVRIPTLRRHREKCGVFEMAVFLLSSVWQVLKRQRREKYDFIVSFFSIPSGPAAYATNLFFGTPFAVALRGADVPGFLPEQLRFFHRCTNGLTRLMWRKAVLLTANSAGLRDLALRFDARPEVRLIPNGVEGMFFDGGTHVAEPRFLRILTVGRLSVQKRVERQIESLGRLKRRGREDFTLTVVGDGPERAKLEALARAEGVSDRVRFLGWIDRGKLPGVYAAADVFCLSSDFEGMPNVVLEAMASSLAVVATRAQGTDELVRPGENGALVERDNLAAMDEAFLKLRDEPALLEAWRARSRELARGYSWDAVARRYEEILKERLP